MKETSVKNLAHIKYDEQEKILFRDIRESHYYRLIIKKI